MCSQTFEHTREHEHRVFIANKEKVLDDACLDAKELQIAIAAVMQVGVNHRITLQVVHVQVR